jgi:phosphoadenosine phosphosulfate reductase
MKMSPVFKEELLMLEGATGEPVGQFESLELWTSNRYYYYDGIRAFKVVGGNFVEGIKIEWLKNAKLLLNKRRNKERLSEIELCQRIKEANRFALGTLEDKAIRFIKGVASTFDLQTEYRAVSFSGGKDSTVVSHLVRKAFSDNGILHVFANTTIETDDTLDFVNHFVSKEKVFLLKAEPQQSYSELVEKGLLPSRIHRWCCTAVKTAPIERILRQILEPGKKVLMFEGTRHEESFGRRLSKPLDCASKIAIQMAARPLLDWSSLEEWLYLLGERLEFNRSYMYGMRRVGCSICPLNSSWSEYVLKYRSPLLANHYIRLIHDSITKLNVDVQVDINNYISKGKWKSRCGGFGMSLSSLAEIPEWDEDYRFTHIGMEEDVDVNRLIEYLKPLFKSLRLEYLYTKVGTKSVILLGSNLTIQGKIAIEGPYISIWWFNEDENRFKDLLSRLKKQLIKYRFCAYCRGCETKCGSQAITVDSNRQTYKVNSDMCIGCGDCINVKIGCILAKSVKSTSIYPITKDVVNA